MVVFEGKAFNEKKVVRISLSGNTIYVYFDNERTPVSMWKYKTETDGISKVNEITALINQREEKLLKLTNS